MEPISASLMVASAAFNAIKKGIEVGRELEDMGGTLGKWFSAVSSINESKARAKNPPLFRKLLSAGSVEQEAMDAVVAEQKLYQMEKELRELIMYRYDEETYVKMIRMRKTIKDDRDAAERKRKQRIRQLFELVAGSILIAVGISLLGYMVYFLYTYK